MAALRRRVNFDAKVRRESHEPIDLFHAHIGGMDAFARGLKIAAAIRADGRLEEAVNDRYDSWNHGVGKDIENGTANFESLESYMLSKGEISDNKSGRQGIHGKPHQRVHLGFPKPTNSSGRRAAFLFYACSRRMIRVPSSGADSTSTRPLWASATLATIANPKPPPLSLVELNMPVKAYSRCSSVMPGPESVKVTVTPCSTAVVAICNFPRVASPQRRSGLGLEMPEIIAWHHLSPAANPARPRAQG